MQVFRYYLKKCGHQELGSVGEDGRPHRGRYLLTSMDPRVQSFFPHLSQTQRNDFVPLPCIPLSQGKQVYCNYVYHNDRFHGSEAAHPRNEFRLYLCKELEGNGIRFKTGDIIIFRKEDEQNNESPLLMEHVPTSAPQYQELDKIIQTSDIRGNYAIYTGTIAWFEDKVSQLHRKHLSTEIDSALLAKLKETSSAPLQATDGAQKTIEDLFTSQTMFRDFLSVGYNYKCAVTRTAINYNGLHNLEAAHIRPRAHGGSWVPNNGILLSRDWHWAFDRGFFTISDDYKIIIHEDAPNDFFEQYNGKELFLPTNSFFRPAPENLKWHRDKLFGLFLKRGVLESID